ncbi:MAG: RHS repeat-associated core domain-containing protein [Candidatus Komeilibacteria bacterium]
MTGSTLDGSADHTEYVYDHTNQRVKKHTIVYTPPPGGDPCDPSHEECPVPEQQTIIVPLEPVVTKPEPKLLTPVDGSLDDQSGVGSMEQGESVEAQTVQVADAVDESGDEVGTIEDPAPLELPTIFIDPVPSLIEPVASSTPDTITTTTPEIIESPIEDIATSTDDIVLPPLDDTEATSTTDRIQTPIELNSMPAVQDTATYYIDKYYEKEYNGASRNFYFLGNIKLATDVLNGSNTGIYYDLSDHLGSSSLTTDTSGQITGTTDYYPYGTISYSNTTTNIGDNHKYTGKELDGETNLSYFGARYYNQTAGYFTSIDSYNLNVDKLTKVLSDPQRLHSYLYSRGNPVVLVDPDGNTPVEYLGGYSIGVGQAVVNFGVGTVESIVHPINTAKSVGNTLKAGVEGAVSLGRDIAANPSQTFGEIRAGLNMNYNEFMDKSDYEKGLAVGNVVGNAALMAKGIEKSGDIQAYKQGASVGLKGERFGVSGDLFKGAKGAGVSLRDFEVKGNYYKTRVLGADVHNVPVGSIQLPLPHLDLLLNGNKIVNHFPWGVIDKLLKK